MRIWSRDWARAGAATSAAAVSAAPAQVRDFMRFSFRNSKTHRQAEPRWRACRTHGT